MQQVANGHIPDWSFSRQWFGKNSPDLTRHELRQLLGNSVVCDLGVINRDKFQCRQLLKRFECRVGDFGAVQVDYSKFQGRQMGHALIRDWKKTQ